MIWESVKLSEICRDDSPITYGILQPGPEVENGVPYVRPSEIKDGQIVASLIRRTSPAIAARYKKSVIHEGDILITIVGTIGHIATVPSELDGGNITQSSARVRVCRSKADRSYVENFLRSPLAARQYDRHRLGVAVARLNLHHVRDLQIPLPPLAEQRRIAGILDAADSLRAKRRESLAQLDTLLQSTFLDMFGDPVTNPMGWDVVKLLEIAELENGDRSNNYPSGSDIIDEGVLFLSTKNIVDYHLCLNACQFISRRKFNSLSRGKLKRNDIVITLRGTLGNCAVFDCHYETGFINAQLLIIRPRGTETPFLHGLLSSQSMNDYFSRNATGAAVKQLTSKQIGALMIPLPPKDLQHRFAAIIESVEQQKASQRAHLDELDTLFASLQSRAFRGDL